MTFRTRSACLVILAAVCVSSPALADNYKAYSKTAESVTGDISFDDYSIVFGNGVEMKFAELVADHFTVDGQKVPASVFSIESPADPELQNGNTLCGGGDVTYIASFSAGDGMTEIDVFTGDDAPTDNAGLCASYIYTD